MRAPVQTGPDGALNYPAWVEKIRTLVPEGKNEKERQVYYAWDAYVQATLTKLWQFTLDHPLSHFPVAYNPGKNEWVWLPRKDRRKMLRRAAKHARQTKTQGAA